MNTTPLIDVMLVLLIMFIVTVPIMTHAVKLDMRQPDPNTARPPQPPRIVDLQIDFDGTVVWNGSVVPGAQALESYFRSESANESQPEIHLRPDRRARYGTVAVVLASAQRNHLKKIGFVNTSEFRD
ncbi:MAG: biopolymer transporter ExbD [Gammaproteobacteria bacterium]